MLGLPYATDPLGKHHDRSCFSCGSAPLDCYLQHQATQDIKRNIAQVFVRCDSTGVDVIGYYSLSMTSIELADVPGDLRRWLPRYPAVPAALLGRLAIHRDHQGAGLGKMLLFDAMRRVYEASRGIGAFGLVVDAKDQAAADFYKRHDFRALTDDESRLILPMATIAQYFSRL